MALTTKRIIALPSQNDPQEGDYLAIDNGTNGTHKIPVGRIGVELDDTLTESGKAADAKATGDAIDALRTQLEVTGTASGAIATFSDGSTMPAKSVVVNIEPQQSGSGTPSPDNVRPISGWESVSVDVSGKNIYNGEGVTIIGRPVERGTTLYTQVFDGTFTNATLYAKTLTADWVAIDSFSQYKHTLTINRDDILEIKISNSAYRDLNNAGSHLMASFTDFDTYEPYTGTTTPVSLGRTVYGGTLDVVSGVLTVTHGYLNCNGSENWQADSSRYTIGVSGSYREGYTRIPVTSNEGAFGTGSSVGTIFLSNTQLYYYPPTSVTSLADFKTWLASNNLQVVYPLATPQTYTLTGQEISTLLGENNVWADSGDVSVVYVRDLNIAINNLIGE